MYNPINMVITDDQRLKECDLRDKNKKKRYETKYLAEEVTRKEGIAASERNEDMSLKKFSFKRMQEEKERGFDIITHGAVKLGPAIVDKALYMKPEQQAWSKINPTAN